MTDIDDRLTEDRITRDAAHAVFRTDLERVRQDLAARGVGERIVDEVNEQAHVALDTALEVANDNKEIVAGTLTALLLWIFRNPLVETIGHLFGRDDHDDAD